MEDSYARRGGSMYAPVFKCSDYAKIKKKKDVQKVGFH